MGNIKYLVVLVCVCAVAHAQFTNQRGGSLYQRESSNFGYQQNQQGQYQPSQSQQNQYHQNQVQQNQVQQNQVQQNQVQQNQYQSRTQQKYQEQTAQTSQYAGSCRENNERYSVPGSCDRYVECINGTAEEKLCPDGLRYNPNLNFNVYPCQYPNEYQCLERSSLQPAQPTAECPNQFGYFKLGDAKNCSYFRNCVNGVSYDFTCPDGLAFSSDTYRCDWPDEVLDCDAEAFLGFRCPEVPTSKELGAPAGFRYYRSEINCQKYFMCIEGRPRGLACGRNSAFDELTSTCVSAEEVSTCPPELRQAAIDAREEENQRLSRELAFNAKGPNPKSRRL